MNTTDAIEEIANSMPKGEPFMIMNGQAIAAITRAIEEDPMAVMSPNGLVQLFPALKDRAQESRAETKNRLTA
jgi:hypothetical protein